MRPSSWLQGITVGQLLCILRPAVAFRIQSVAAGGQLMCGRAPAVDAHVALVHAPQVAEDRHPTRPTVVIASGRSDALGRFALEGTARQGVTLRPMLSVAHWCGQQRTAGGEPCRRRWTVGVPEKYVSTGSHAAARFDLGTVNMEVGLGARGSTMAVDYLDDDDAARLQLCSGNTGTGGDGV